MLLFKGRDREVFCCFSREAPLSFPMNSWEPLYQKCDFGDSLSSSSSPSSAARRLSIPFDFPLLVYLDCFFKDFSRGILIHTSQEQTSCFCLTIKPGTYFCRGISFSPEVTEGKNVSYDLIFLFHFLTFECLNQP